MDKGGVDDLTFGGRESGTESINGGASSARAAEEVLDVPEPSMAFEDVFVNGREIRDVVVLEVVFSRRAVLVITVPHFLRGAFRDAMRSAMDQATHAQACRHQRGWKLFMFLPRCHCTDHRGKGTSPKNKLVSRAGSTSGSLGCSDRCQ